MSCPDLEAKTDLNTCGDKLCATQRDAADRKTHQLDVAFANPRVVTLMKKMGLGTILVQPCRCSDISLAKLFPDWACKAGVATGRTEPISGLVRSGVRERSRRTAAETSSLGLRDIREGGSQRALTPFDDDLLSYYT